MLFVFSAVHLLRPHQPGTSTGLLRPSAGQTSNVLIPFNLTLPDGVYNFASAATPPGRLLSMQIVITYRVPAGQSSYKSDMSLGLFSGICEMSWGGVTSSGFCFLFPQFYVTPWGLFLVSLSVKPNILKRFDFFLKPLSYKSLLAT